MGLRPGATSAGPAGGPASGPADAWRTADPLVRTTSQGVALMEQYNYVEAAKVFERAVDLAPESIEARRDRKYHYFL